MLIFKIRLLPKNGAYVCFYARQFFLPSVAQNIHFGEHKYFKQKKRQGKTLLISLINEQNPTSLDFGNRVMEKVN